METFRGEAAIPWLEEVAALRIEVFREWPYLYEGDAGYERDYLRRYAECPESVVVLARAGEEVIGASTGLPLAAAEGEFRAPFVKAGWEVGEVFYFGESVLRADWRGLGVGHAFFDEREKAATSLPGIRWTSFCAVERSVVDPRRPSGARSLEPFWRGRGYEKRPELLAEFEWREVGAEEEVRNRLVFWLRECPGRNSLGNAAG